MSSSNGAVSAHGPLLLLVDDDPGIIQATSRLLADFGRCRFARSAVDALRMLQAERVDLVLLDAEMPEMGGFELLSFMKAAPELADIPVVLLTSHRDEAIEESAFAAGAVDYMSKPIRPGVLRARIRTQLELQRVMAEVRSLSRTDSLTGLTNRRAMQERLELEVGRAKRVKSSLSLLMIDVDFFKRFNDHYGHAIGDQALVQVAASLRAVAGRPGDLAVRWGGEEFLVLLSNTDIAGALTVAEHLHQSLAAAAVPHEASPIGRLSCSVGVAALDFAAETGSAMESGARRQALIERLLAEADSAMYAAKEAGRNGTQAARQA